MENKQVTKFKNGQKWSSNFDYNGMLEYALKVKPTDSLKKLKMLAYSMNDVNYHSTAVYLHDAITKLTIGMFDITIEIERFKQAVLNDYYTKVSFYYNEKNDDLYAFFTETILGNLGESYSHIGQHSQCHINYVKESRKATKKEYKDLMLELQNIGYHLNVID